MAKSYKVGAGQGENRNKIMLGVAAVLLLGAGGIAYWKMGGPSIEEQYVEQIQETREEHPEAAEAVPVEDTMEYTPEMDAKPAEEEQPAEEGAPEPQRRRQFRTKPLFKPD